jgi:hypothetical protein
MNESTVEEMEHVNLVVVERLDKLEKLVGQCEHNGKLQYQTMISKEDLPFTKGEKAYCVVEADACPFVYIFKNHYYCRNILSNKNY